MELNERLLAVRQRKGLSQRQASMASGLTHASIYRYEQGVEPGIVAVEKLANAYGVSPIYLAGWEKYISNEKTTQFAEKFRSLTTIQQEAVIKLIETLITETKN